MEGGAVGHNFEIGIPKDYPSQICFNLVQRSLYIPGFSVKFFFQPIFTDYAN
jgi:hypothetical protein